jgi:hypothetical protein
MFNRKEYMKEYHKKWYKKNKKKVLETSRKWAKENPEKVKIISNRWVKNNREKHSLNSKRWYKKNIKHVSRRSVAYNIKKYRTDPTFKLKACLRSRIISVLKERIKSAPTLKLLGVSNVEFVWIHLEKSFKPGMTRKNHGKWHIDHIKPCSSFDLSKPKQQAKCFHYSNLQALWAHENLSKGDKIS